MIYRPTFAFIFCVFAVISFLFYLYYFPVPKERVCLYLLCVFFFSVAESLVKSDAILF